VKYLIVTGFLFTLLLTVGGCISSRGDSTADEKPQEVVVFAAASLTEVLTEAGKTFEQDHPDVRLVFNFAGSQQLASQLAQGAQADLFASADQRQMDAAVTAGRIDPADVTIFACNRLVVVTSDSRIDSLQALARPGVKLVIGAQAVPVGVYTQALLAAASADPLYGPAFGAGVMANVVSYEQSVRAVLGKVRLGEADAGIVYASDARAAPDVHVLEIPDSLNQIASYPLASVLDGPLEEDSSTALARQFIDFLHSSRSRDILTGAGFSVECAPALEAPASDAPTSDAPTSDAPTAKASISKAPTSKASTP